MPTKVPLGQFWPRHVARTPRSDPLIPMFREFAYWRRANRFYFEHWLIMAIVLVVFGNAALLLALGQ